MSIYSTSLTVDRESFNETNSNEPHDVLYSRHINPQWVTLLNTLGMNVKYESSLGAEVCTEDKRRLLDFLSGHCVYNAGHNHPRIVAALADELYRGGPAMLQSHVPEPQKRSRQIFLNIKNKESEKGGNHDKENIHSSNSIGSFTHISYTTHRVLDEG